MPGKLGLSAEQIERCRTHARRVAEGVRRETELYTTVSTERAVLRLLGVDGVDRDEVPIPNRVVEALRAAARLGRGAAVWMGSALACWDGSIDETARRLADPDEARGLPEHPRWHEALAPH